MAPYNISYGERPKGSDEEFTHGKSSDPFVLNPDRREVRSYGKMGVGKIDVTLISSSNDQDGLATYSVERAGGQKLSGRMVMHPGKTETASVLVNESTEYGIKAEYIDPEESVKAQYSIFNQCN